MKKLKLFFAMFVILFFSSQTFAQGVGISAGVIVPDPSAMLDISSTSKGVLIPRMTMTERNAISSPANGLLIFCTDDNNFYSNKGTSGTPNWVMIGSVTTQNQVKLARALNTVYQNTTGRIMYVSIITVNNAVGTTKVLCDNTTSPTTKVSAVSGGDGWNRNTFFIVLPNYYYLVTMDGSGGYIDSWIEWY
jgi:hypothetical protein